MKNHPSYKDDNCGIYKIINTINGKFYIGSSKNIQSRFHAHKSLLKYNKHGNKHLQAAWNKYGTESFKFEIYKEVESNNLLLEEQRYLDILMGKSCYNIAKSVTAPGLGISPSDETRKKMSKIMSGRIRSKEHRENLSKALLGNVVSQKTKQKLHEINIGKKLSKKTKQKMSNFWKGKTNNPNKQLNERLVLKIRNMFKPNTRGIMKEISQKLGISYKSVCDVIYEKSWTHIR